MIRCHGQALPGYAHNELSLACNTGTSQISEIFSRKYLTILGYLAK
jgi:hypothetical protein